MSTSLECAKSIFVTAIEKYQPHEWPIFLDGACGDDQHLRAQVEELLDAHREVDSFLDKPTAAIADAPEEKIGTKIGSFKLLQKIGEGGFGVVYMAEQMKPIRRKVALKIIKPGMDSKDVIARFEAERQALAMMDHPNIAKVLDAGTTEDGRPYFAMELVKGVSLTEYADNNHLATKERLQLFAAVCRAVHHAHQKGVIHRDLKPSNVMVTLHDGKPVCKVIDFGVSKAMSQPLTEQTLFTRYGQVIGTPQYMSPEQAEMSGLDVDTRSDIYSLGVILYELLTGRTPFLIEQIRAAGFDEMRRMIREQEPVRPSNVLQTLDADTATTVACNRSAKPESLQRMVRGELDWIVMRSLEKDRNRRYDSASSLADDVDRHLNDEPVEATPPSLSYNLWKAYRRNRGVCLAGGSIAAALLIATGISVFAMQSARDSARRANNAKAEAFAQRELAEQASIEADSQRKLAEVAKVHADEEATSSKQTLTLLLSVFSKANFNPGTNEPYTVREAMMELSNLSLGDRSDSNAKFALDGHFLGESPMTLRPRASIELNMGLAKAFRSTGNHDRATSHYRKALTVLDEILGQPDTRQAECKRYIGFYDGEEQLLRESIELERTLNDQPGQVASLTLLGRHFIKHERWDDAIEVLQEATELFEPNNKLHLDEVPQFYLARVYRRQLGEESRARELENLAVQCVSKSLVGTSQQWLKRAKSLRSARQMDEAELALLVCQSAEDQDNEGLVCYELGQLLLQLCKNYDIHSEANRAAHYFERSLNKLVDSENADLKASTSMRFAEALVMASKDEKAIPILQEFVTSKNDHANTAIFFLHLIAFDNPEVKKWLTQKRIELEQEFELASEPSDVRSLSLILGSYELVDGNMQRCMEFLGKGGYSVYGTTRVGSLAVERGFTDAAHSYFACLLEQYELRERNDSEWRYSSLARSFYENGNPKPAVDRLRRAVELSRKRANRDEFLHFWVCYELGLLLRNSNEEEAKTLFAEVAEGLSKAAASGKACWWHEDLDRAVQLHCELLVGEAIDLEAIETELYRRIAFAGRAFPGCILHEALAELELQRGQLNKSIDSLEAGVSQLDNRLWALPVWNATDRLVKLYQKTDELSRGCNFFRELITDLNSEFPERHPRRAFLRLNFAEILLAMEGHEAEAMQVLEEAKAIFGLHEIIPDHVHEKLDALLDKASEKAELAIPASANVKSAILSSSVSAP